jgi:acyl carrier protein
MDRGGRSPRLAFPLSVTPYTFSTIVPVASGRPVPPFLAVPGSALSGGSRVSVEQKVIEIVCEHLAVNKEQVTRNTNFIEDIGADSLDIVELIMELEEEFDIQIPDEQAEKIKTVGEAIDYIERETKKKS